jgi:hypothetical protein
MDSGITRGKPSQPSHFHFNQLKENKKTLAFLLLKPSQNPRNPRNRKSSSEFSLFAAFALCAAFDAAGNFPAVLLGGFA